MDEGEVPAVTGNSWLSNWRRHLIVEGSGRVACVQCGRFGTDRKNALGVFRSNWLHQPCLGCKGLPEGLVKLLHAGVFDGSLRAKDEPTKERIRVLLEAANVVVL